jgi:hypothetical protein
VSPLFASTAKDVAGRTSIAEVSKTALKKRQGEAMLELPRFDGRVGA